MIARPDPIYVRTMNGVRGPGRNGPVPAAQPSRYTTNMNTRIKGPPYKVVFGENGSQPPPYVEFVYDSYVTLGGEGPAIIRALQSVGLTSKLGRDV